MVKLSKKYDLSIKTENGLNSLKTTLFLILLISCFIFFKSFLKIDLIAFFVI